MQEHRLGTGSRLLRTLLFAFLGAIVVGGIAVVAVVAMSNFYSDFGQIAGFFVLPAGPVGVIIGAVVGWRKS